MGFPITAGSLTIEMRNYSSLTSDWLIGQAINIQKGSHEYHLQLTQKGLRPKLNPPNSKRLSRIASRTGRVINEESSRETLRQIHQSYICACQIMLTVSKTGIMKRIMLRKNKQTNKNREKGERRVRLTRTLMPSKTKGQKTESQWRRKQ